MNKQFARYFGAFIAGCIVSTLATIATNSLFRSQSAFPEPMEYCQMNKGIVERWVGSGWDINTAVKRHDGSSRFIILEEMLDDIKCHFDDELAAYYLESGGVIDIKALIEFSKLAKHGGSPKTAALIAKLKSDL